MDHHRSVPFDREIGFTIERQGHRRWTEAERRALLRRAKAAGTKMKPAATPRRPRGRKRGS